MSTASSAAAAAPEQVQRQSSSAADHNDQQQQERRLHPSQRVRFDWLEVVGCKRQTPPEELVDMRREHVMHMRRAAKQQKAAEEAEAAGADPTAAAAAAAAEAADDDDDDDAAVLSPEEDQFVHEPVLLPLPLEQLRIKPHIIERQLEPLLRARTAAELADAHAEAIQNLQSLRAFDDRSRLSISANVSPAPSMVDVMRLAEQGGTHLEGNKVRAVTREGSTHPTWLERIAGRTVGALQGAVKGAARLVRLRASDDDDDDDEDDAAGAVTPLGGAFLPPGHRDTLTVPLKLTLTLPPEKTAGGKLGLSTTSESSGRAEMSLSGALTGYAGHAERVEFSLRQGVNSTSWLDLGENSLLLSVSVPEIFTRKSTSAMQVALERHHMPDSSLESLVKGGSVTWAHAGGRHALTASLAHRTLRACSAKMTAGGDDSAAAGGAAPAWREPSPTILALASGGVGVGRSLKSSLKYSFAHSRLDCGASPTRGWSLGASGELAGLLGDAAFLRVDVDAKRYWQLPLLPRALGASIGVGCLGQGVHNLSSRTPRVFVADRLFLGHSLTLRGHAPNAAGPRDGLDALGGELALAGAVHLGFNLPSFESHGLRGGFFWNAGNLLGFQNEVAKGAGAAAAQPASSVPVQGAAILPRGASLSTITSSFLATTRQSVGFGIRGTVQGARLEFNVAHPLGTQDAPSAGKWPIEFGIGVQWV